MRRIRNRLYRLLPSSTVFYRLLPSSTVFYRLLPSSTVLYRLLPSSCPMLLAININNTETKVGLFRGDSLESHWRLTTTPSRTPDEWAATLTAYLAQAGRSTQEVRAAVVASVVPPVTQGLCEAVQQATTVSPVVVDGRSARPITLDVEEPLQVGADRILNTLAAPQLFHRDSMVVDFVTATTFDCITAVGHF